MTTPNSHQPVGTCTSMVTQMYTFSSWTKQNGHGSSSMMPYVGFPGLSLTPIPESPLLDSMLSEDGGDLTERDRWIHPDLPGDDPLKHNAQKNGVGGTGPRKWLGRGKAARALPSIEDSGEGEVGAKGGGGEKGCRTSPGTCSVNVQVVHTTTFLPKDEAMTPQEKRAHQCKLLLFALCGFVIVAGIVLWIFSSAFT